MSFGLLGAICLGFAGHHLPEQEFKVIIVTKGPVMVPVAGTEAKAEDRDLALSGSLKITPKGESDLLETRLRIAGRSHLKTFLQAIIPEGAPSASGGIGRKGDEILFETSYQFGVGFRGNSKSIWRADQNEDPGMQWVLASALGLVDHQRTHPSEKKFILTEVNGMSFQAEVKEADFIGNSKYLRENFKKFSYVVARKETATFFPKYLSGTFILQKSGGRLKEMKISYDINDSPSAEEPRGVLAMLLSHVQVSLEDVSLAEK